MTARKFEMQIPHSVRNDKVNYADVRNDKGLADAGTADAIMCFCKNCLLFLLYHTGEGETAILHNFIFGLFSAGYGEMGKNVLLTDFPVTALLSGKAYSPRMNAEQHG